MKIRLLFLLGVVLFLIAVIEYKPRPQVTCPGCNLSAEVCAKGCDVPVEWKYVEEQKPIKPTYNTEPVITFNPTPQLVFPGGVNPDGLAEMLQMDARNKVFAHLDQEELDAIRSIVREEIQAMQNQKIELPPCYSSGGCLNLPSPFVTSGGITTPVDLLQPEK